MKPKLLRITTIPLSLHKLLQGQVNYMQENGFEVVLACADGKEIDAIEKDTGLKVNILPLTRKISLFKDIQALWATYKLIKKEKPDIVHTHTPKAGLLGMLASKLARVPVRMHTVAGLPLMQATGIKRKILNFTEQLTSWTATNVYPNSFALKNFIIDNNLVNPKKVKVLAKGSSNGIDVTYFNSQNIAKATQQNLEKELGIGPNDIVFCFIGRLVGDKGINELIVAFEELQTTNKNIKLLLVGDQEASLDPLHTTTIKSIKENLDIITTGWVEDVRLYLAISDVFVFPSYREGMPNVVLQAGAMELPQIVTDINGSNEIIIDNKNGLIIPVKDSTALLLAIQQMLESTLREKLSKNARKLIINRFKQQVVWDALLEEYRAAILNNMSFRV